MGEIAASFLASFAICVVLGAPILRVLTRMGVKQTVSSDAPTGHIAKQGTPTMGGLMILAGIALPMIGLVLVRPGQIRVLSLILLTLAFGAIGFIDDFLIVSRGKNLGLKARQKLILQFLFAIAFVMWLRSDAVAGRTTLVALFGNSFDLGGWYYVLGALFIVAMSNAVNLTDGLDGLAAGVSALIALALAGTVLSTGSFAWLCLFAGALAGACAGFLYYNFPASVFMGDTGSLAIGAALAGIAMQGKVEAPFQIYAVVPWIETFTVILQVLVFKLRRRSKGLEYAKSHRVFLRTPLHHHYEEMGWKETRIVGRFWLATIVSIAVALTFS